MEILSWLVGGGERESRLVAQSAAQFGDILVRRPLIPSSNHTVSVSSLEQGNALFFPNQRLELKHVLIRNLESP